MNRLSQEISPYLLQHAHNPVDWYPWGEEALARAKSEDKPIFLSIGYATCHWCHVMEGDSFEKEDVAALLNEHFISIKVDREERPDVDSIYMKAVQAMNQRGGWPLSVMLTPDGKPFWGGTFFPREQFKNILGQIAHLWRQRRPDIDDNAAELAAHIEMTSLGGDERAKPELSALSLARFTQQEIAAYDPEWGGFGGAPKFPPAMALMALLRQQLREPEPKLLTVIKGTLDGMARGGMRDHVGGGFHRYAVDASWLVPHFEKMLYDNALLTMAYAEAFQSTAEPSYADVVHSTLRYIIRDMQGAEGAFHSAEDADSEKTEGKFYVWTREQWESRLSPDEQKLFLQTFDVRPEGNFSVDRRVEALEEAAGMKAVHAANILHHQKKPLLPRLDDPSYQGLLQRLLAIRSERIRPGRDDKVLCAWNGLMIAALAKAHRVFGNEEYKEAASKAALFLLSRLRGPDGQLLRSYRAGQARYAAYLEDYASLIFGLIELYQASFDPGLLVAAFELQKLQDQLFWNEEEGAYYETDGRDTTLILRSIDIQDNAVPSGNSLSALNLLQLEALSGRLDFQEKAQKILNRCATALEGFPRSMPMMLLAVDRMHAKAPTMVIATANAPLPWPGLAPDFLPHLAVIVAHPSLEEHCPLLRGKTGTGAGARYFVCELGSCQAPTSDHSIALKQIKGGPRP